MMQTSKVEEALRADLEAALREADAGRDEAQVARREVDLMAAKVEKLERDNLQRERRV